MRSFIRRTIIAGSCLGACIVGSVGCEAKKATEYVAGISTQVTVPRDLKVVRIDISVSGTQQSCKAYRVYDGKVLLPRSLGAYPQRESALGTGPIQYTVVGFTDAIDIDGPNPLIAACAQPKVGQDQARILRRSRQPYIPDEILYLPMPLKYACFDKNCEKEDETCKGGKCVSATLNADQAKLAFPRYTPELVDGTGGACFHTDLCMAAAAPVVPVDSNNCIYAVPNTPSAPAPLFGVNPFSGPSSGDGVNVEVTYDSGLVREVLDLDAEEGFSIPDPKFPQRFKLAPGLCEMVKGVDDKNAPTPHRITALRTSGTCQSKKLAQPFCANDMLKQMGVDTNGVSTNPLPVDACSSVELKPPQAALVVVVDNTALHNQFFVALNKNVINVNDEETLVEPAIKAALSDPAFERTDVGLVYAGPKPGVCAAPTDPPTPLDVESGRASLKRDEILENLKKRVRAGDPVALEDGLVRAYNELNLAKYNDHHRRAVLVLSNSGFTDPDGCLSVAGGPVERATDARSSNPARPIDTYVMQLTKDPPPIDDVRDQLAKAGGTDTAAYKVDAARNKFQEIVNKLGTCVYDVPNDQTAPKAGDIVSFGDPLSPTPATSRTDIVFNAACDAENKPGDGWGYSANPAGIPAGKKRIYLCANQCNKYRDVLKNLSTFSATYGQSPVPVPIFAYSKCGP